MTTAELDVTLAPLSLTAEILQSGNVLHITLEGVSLVSTCSITAYGSASCLLENLSLSSESSVYITSELNITLDELTAMTFGKVYTGINSPYEDVLSWTGHPLTGSRVRVRTGNLRGIFGVDGEFGIYAGDGWDLSSGVPPSVSSQYIRLGNYTNEFHNVPINLYDNGDITMQMEPDAPSFAMGSTLPIGYSVGVGLWQGKDTDDIYKWRVGDPVGANLSWNGTSLALNNASLDVSGTNVHIALGNPPPTAHDTGTGIWMDNSGIYGLNEDTRQFYIDAATGIFYSGAGTLRIDEDGANIVIGTYNELNQLTGVEINSTGIYTKIDDIDQTVMGVNGKLVAGAGDITIDSIGVKMIETLLDEHEDPYDSTAFLVGNLNGEYGITNETIGLGIGNYALDEYMTYDSNNGMNVTGRINARRGSLQDLSVDGILTVASAGKIQIGSVEESTIIIENERIIGLFGVSQSTGFVLGNLNLNYGETTDIWGFAVGSSDLSGQYLKFSGDTMTLKGTIISGNSNVIIDENGLYIKPDASSPDYTNIIRFLSGSTTFMTLDGYDEGTTRPTIIRLTSFGINNSSELLLGSEAELSTKTSAVILKSNVYDTYIGTLELYSSSSGTAITIKTDTTTIDSETVSIRGGEVSTVSVANGIPQANALGKIDPSWISEEEAETGTFDIPGNTMFLWPDGVSLPAIVEYVTALDGYYTMGDAATDLLTIYGASTHTHTNPSIQFGGGHNNHAVTISGSSNNIPGASACYYMADKAWMVGTHSHTSGSATNQSTAGTHAHSGSTLTTVPADNLNIPKSYKGLRWVRATADIEAPIYAIVMDVAGATLGDDWKVCDGSNGTPDLTDYFIYPSTSGSPIGSNAHSHTSYNTTTESTHTHTVDVTSNSVGYNRSSEFGNNIASGIHSHTKTGAVSSAGGSHYHTINASSTASNMPPYFVVKFWQRRTDTNDMSFPAGIVFGLYSGSVPSLYREFIEGRGYIPKGATGGEIIGSRHGTAGGTTHTHTPGAISTSGAHGHSVTGNISYNNAGGASRPAALPTPQNTDYIASHYHTFTMTFDEISGHTHSWSSTTTSAENALPPYRKILFIVKESGTAPEIPQAVFLTTPLTSTSWDGDTKTTSDRAIIDLSTVFGVPAGIKAVMMTIQTQANAVNDYIRFGPNSTYNYALICRTEIADQITNASGIVPCDANGDIYCYPSGTVEGVWIWIWAYWL
jgi:hypothetical protein